MLPTWWDKSMADNTTTNSTPTSHNAACGMVAMASAVLCCDNKCRADYCLLNNSGTVVMSNSWAAP